MSSTRDLTSASYVFVLFLRLMAVLILLAAAAASLGHLHWRLELATHWLPQIALVSLLCCIALAVKREWILALLLAGSALALGTQVAPWLNFGDDPEPQAESFTVFYANVLRANKSSERLAAQIAQADPDMVVLVEVDRRWLSDLEPVLAGYPERLENPLDNNFGVAFYSRLPVESAELIYFGPEHEIDGPGIVASVMVQDVPVQVFGVHTLPPAALQFAVHRDLQLEDLADRIATVPGQVVVVGDLNTTMYAQGYKDLLSRTGLTNAREGKGLMGTWPAGFSGLFRIPIDHVLVSDGLQVTSLQVGDYAGSDHRALIAELAIVADYTLGQAR